MIDFLRRFKENEIQNKDDLLYSLRSMYDNFDSDSSATQSRKELLEKFIARIEAMQLPRCDDWWFYSYLKGHNTVQISQNIEDKTIFDVLLDGHTGICLSAAECEKLELALLALADIAVCEFYDI